MKDQGLKYTFQQSSVQSCIVSFSNHYKNGNQKIDFQMFGENIQTSKVLPHMDLDTPTAPFCLKLVLLSRKTRT